MRTVLIDVLCLAGISLAGYGLWQFSPPLTFVVGGSGLIAIAVKNRKPKETK